MAADIVAGRPSPLAATGAMSVGPDAADWSRVLFVSPFLHSVSEDVRTGRLFEAVRLSDVADIGCGRDVRGCFDASRTPDRDARASIYGHDTSRVVSIENRPYTYLIPKSGMAERAKRAWSKASYLLFPEKLRLNLTHVTAVCSPDVTVGTSWYCVRPCTGAGGGEDELAPAPCGGLGPWPCSSTLRRASSRSWARAYLPSCRGRGSRARESRTCTCRASPASRPWR